MTPEGVSEGWPLTVANLPCVALISQSQNLRTAERETHGARPQLQLLLQCKSVAAGGYYLIALERCQ
jgi:hypothetical protein